MVFFTSSMDGLRLGSLSQQWVIRVSMGSGRSLISGGRVPASQETPSQRPVSLYAIHTFYLTDKTHHRAVLVRSVSAVCPSPLWTAHMMQNAEPPISSKGFLRVMTSHRMMPQLNTSHFSL